MFPQFFAEWKAKTEQKLADKEKEKVRFLATKIVVVSAPWKRIHVEIAASPATYQNCGKIIWVSLGMRMEPSFGLMGVFPCC